MKRRIFLVCLFYCFFRLPIYESIAAIFWQSASYVRFSCKEDVHMCPRCEVVYKYDKKYKGKTKKEKKQSKSQKKKEKNNAS